MFNSMFRRQMVHSIRIQYSEATNMVAKSMVRSMATELAEKYGYERVEFLADCGFDR